MRSVLPSFLVVAALAAPTACAAKVQITVDLSTQTMNVDSASGSYSWPISSARDGYVTPRGTYGVQSLQTMHFSKKYHNSPMPHSIFFDGGYAIHGTYEVGSLGRPASHGCVRISPAHAATLYALVQQEGATIRIVGSASNASFARRIDPQDWDAAPRSDVAPAVVARRRVAEARPAAAHDNPLALIFGFSAPNQAAEPTRARGRR
jgi:hypothetical protein